jgi:hypothetical protein
MARITVKRYITSHAICARMFWPQLSANAWNLCGDNVK